MNEKQNESRQGRQKTMRHPTRLDFAESRNQERGLLSPGALDLSEHRSPPLKRRAILERPCGTKTQHIDIESYALLH